VRRSRYLQRIEIDPFEEFDIVEIVRAHSHIHIPISKLVFPVDIHLGYRFRLITGTRPFSHITSCAFIGRRDDLKVGSSIHFAAHREIVTETTSFGTL